MKDIGMDAPPDYDTPSQHTQLSSGPSSPVIPALVLTAAEEKEQQRKRYEAATGGSGSGSGSSAPPPAAATDRQPTYLSAAEEKEIHKKRYNDAISRTGGGGSIERTDSPSSGMPWATLSAAEEKELQRKRYEEATGRVGASDAGSISSRAVSPSPYPNGTSSPAPIGDPVPYDAIYGNQSAKVNTGPRELSDKEAMNRYVDKRSTRIVSNPTASPTPPLVLHARERPTSMQVGPTPLSGSIAMKMYHDNQGRGDRSVQQSIPKGQEAPPPFAGSSSSRQLPAGGAGLPVDEKAQMKRYYEALDKVNNAQGGSSSSAPIADRKSVV